MSEEMTVYLGLDSGDVQAQLAATRGEMDRLTSDWAKRKDKIILESQQIINIVNTGLRLWKNMFVAMGGTIDPALEAALAVIETGFVAAQGVFSIYAAMGPAGAIIGLVMMMASMKFQMMAQDDAKELSENAKRSLSAATASMLQMQQMTSQLGRLF
jgi:hypothetical protein